MRRLLIVIGVLMSVAAFAPAPAKAGVSVCVGGWCGGGGWYRPYSRWYGPYGWYRVVPRGRVRQVC